MDILSNGSDLPILSYLNETTTSDTVLVRKWPILLMTSILPFCSMLLATALFKGLLVFVRFASRKRRQAAKEKSRFQAMDENFSSGINDDTNLDETECQHCLSNSLSRIVGYCTLTLLGQSISGKILIIATTCFSIMDFGIYLITVLSERFFKTRVEFSVQPMNPFRDEVALADFVGYCFFFVLFVLKFVATQSRIIFFFELQTVVDFATIPPVFVEIFLGDLWLGLRFFRCFRLVRIPDFLQYLGIIRNSDVVRLTQLVCIFLTMVIASAGIIFLLENSGDPHQLHANAVLLDFGNCLYYIMITISTVGYGDISPQTVLGRVFIVLFILVALALFASMVPEIVEIISRFKHEGLKYRPTGGIKHVVVSGYVDYQVVQNYVINFHHEDRELGNLKSVFLYNEKPDLPLETLFKRHHTKIVLVKGTLMRRNDMNRVAMKEAEACLIIANVKSENPEKEDAANIMRIISIKNYLPETRIVVQLLTATNKLFCLNLPSWTSRDQAICISELKLSIMGSACLVPGIPALICNLTTMISATTERSLPQWKRDYVYGAGMEIYIKNFSPSFFNKSFTEAVYTCYSKLKLVLFGLIISDQNRERVVVNPGDDYIVAENTKGFFICESEKDANRVLVFCSRCHQNLVVRKIKKCKCKDSLFLQENLDSIKPLIETIENNNTRISERFHSLPKQIMLRSSDSNSEVKFESTGLFYWVPVQNIEDCVLNEEKVKNFRDHVILIFTEASDTTLNGIQNFVLPLRASSLPVSKLHPILIFLDKVDSIRYEWGSISHFPLIYIYEGKCLSRKDLRSIQLEFCHMCVILTSSSSQSDDKSLIDKTAIMTHLIIKTIPASKVMRRYKFNKFSTAIDIYHNVLIRNNALDEVRKIHRQIPVLCEIADEGNVSFLDQDDEDEDDCLLYLTQPYACSTAFVSRVLDSLMYSIYFSPHLLNLVRCLMSGANVEELEQMSTDGIGWTECALEPDVLHKKRNRSYLSLLKYDSLPMTKYSQKKYGEVFISLLTTESIVCLGVYRRMGSYSLDPMAGESNPHRFVITNPSQDFILHTTDELFCLRLFSQVGMANPKIKESNIF